MLAIQNIIPTKTFDNAFLSICLLLLYTFYKACAIHIFTEKHIEAANKSKDLAFIGVLWPLNVFAAELIRR